MFHPLEPHILIIPFVLFYVGIDIVFSLYYAGKYEDKNWSKVKTIGVFTRALKKAMKKSHESFETKGYRE